MEKTGVKVVKKKPPYKAYVLLGTLVVLGIVVVLLSFGPARLFKKEEAPQILITQKRVKAPSKPPEKKLVLVKKKPVVQASRSVDIKSKAPPPKKLPPKRSSTKSPKKFNRTQEINAFLMKWKAAWENTAGAAGDMETYMSFYSDDFSTKGLDKSGWKQDKAGKNKANDWIRIGIKNINILGKPENKSIEVNFLQDYQSSNYASVSEKTLLLRKEKLGWKIIGIKTAPRSYAHFASYPYSIHLGSYRSIQSARQTIRDHQLMGLQTFWVRVDLGKKGVWYRIFAGCYKNLEAAEKIIRTKELKAGRPERTRYANFIGTYLSEGNLKKQNQSLLKNGYAPYFIKDDQGKFHLFVGAFYKEKNAKKLSAELNSKGIPSQVLKR